VFLFAYILPISNPHNKAIYGINPLLTLILRVKP